MAHTDGYQLQIDERFTNVESSKWPQYVLQDDFIRTKKQKFGTHVYPFLLSISFIGMCKVSQHLPGFSTR